MQVSGRRQRDQIAEFIQMILIIQSIYLLVGGIGWMYLMSESEHAVVTQSFVFPSGFRLLLLTCLKWYAVVWPIIRCHGHFFEMLLALRGIILIAHDYNGWSGASRPEMSYCRDVSLLSLNCSWARQLTKSSRSALGCSICILIENYEFVWIWFDRLHQFKSERNRERRKKRKVYPTNVNVWLLVLHAKHRS